jgi:hypothetical protein
MFTFPILIHEEVIFDPGSSEGRGGGRFGRF